MAIKEKILHTLEKRKGEYISGEMLAEMFSVSRTAVWKAVKQLQEKGCPIDAVTNKGYCLSASCDLFSEEGLRRYLRGGVGEKIQAEVYDVVLSTNTLLKARAEEGAPEGLVIAAGAQTAGRGRRGRSFFSPSDTGLYLSLLLRPDVSAKDAGLITTAAAVAVCRAIETATGLQPQIKWVNDIFLQGKKVCGILTEGSFDMENGHMDYAVLGVGINVYPPEGDFPAEIREVAGFLLSRPQDQLRNRLAAEFLNHFWPYYSSVLKGGASVMLPGNGSLDGAMPGNDASKAGLPGNESSDGATKGNELPNGATPDTRCRHRELIEAYRSRCFVIGRTVQVLSADGSARAAEALDIDEYCHLIVRYEDGTQEHLSSGEISIRSVR